jgi:hypothetical protein
MTLVDDPIDDEPPPLTRAQILRVVVVCLGIFAAVGLVVGRLTWLRVDVAGAIVVALVVGVLVRAVVAAKRRALPLAHVLGAAGWRGLRRRQLTLAVGYARLGAIVVGCCGTFIGAAHGGRLLRVAARTEARARADEEAPPPCPSCQAHQLADEYAEGLRRKIAEREQLRATMAPEEWQAYEQAQLDEIRRNLPNASTSTAPNEGP